MCNVGTLVGSCKCTKSWCDFDWTFGLAVVALTHKILSRLYLGIVESRKLILGRDIG